jgi:hypothetical protein
MNKQYYYRLFDEDCNKSLIKSTNKQELLLFIDENGDKTKFYTIYKIKNNISIWWRLINRRLFNDCGEFIFSKILIIYYDKDTNKWKYHKVH